MNLWLQQGRNLQQLNRHVAQLPQLCIKLISKLCAGDYTGQPYPSSLTSNGTSSSNHLTAQVHAVLSSARASSQKSVLSQIAEEAAEVLRSHERSKEQLCQELNLLVHQSATAELNKLEQLTQQLESLNG